MLNPVTKLDYCTAQENNAAFYTKDGHGSGASRVYPSGRLLHCIGIDLGGNTVGSGVEHQRHTPHVGFDWALHVFFAVDAAFIKAVATALPCQPHCLKKLCSRQHEFNRRPIFYVFGGELFVVEFDCADVWLRPLACRRGWPLDIENPNTQVVSMAGHGHRLNRLNCGVFGATKLRLSHHRCGHDDGFSGIVCFFDFLGKVD